jgi:hypothetical protein
METAMTDFDIRRDASGAVDFDFYRRHASVLRRQARTDSLRSALRILRQSLVRPAAWVTLRLPLRTRTAA